MTTALAAADSVAAAAQALTGALVAAFTPDRIAVYRSGEDGHLCAVHRHGSPDGIDLDEFAVADPADDLPVGKAVRTGAPVWVASREELLTRYPRLADIAAPAETCALAVLPLVMTGRVTGAVALTFDRPTVLRSDQRSLATAFATQAAQAFERAGSADARRAIAAVLQQSLLSGGRTVRFSEVRTGARRLVREACRLEHPSRFTAVAGCQSVTIDGHG